MPTKQVEETVETAKTPEQFVNAEVTQSESLDEQIEKAFIYNQKMEQFAATLKPGKDYNDIQGSKSLGKAGAEKVFKLFSATAAMSQDHETWDMSGKQVGLYCYVCRVVDANGQIIGEGRGAADVKEKSNWNANNAIKIAEKRAYVDAALRTFALSSIFTQDIEDMDLGNSSPVVAASKYNQNVAKAVDESNSPPCPKCGSPMRLRKGSRGDFYGCSKYPGCNGTMNASEWKKENADVGEKSVDDDSLDSLFEE